MTEWIITDTHFGHKGIVAHGHRPANHEALMIDALDKCVKLGDIIVHLGDVSLGSDDESHRHFTERYSSRAKLWLTLGNHDQRGFAWYLERGWDFVGHGIGLDRYGVRALLTHIPYDIRQPEPNIERYTANIHGHLHIGTHRTDYESKGWYSDRTHYLVSMELQAYKPVALKTICAHIDEAQTR